MKYLFLVCAVFALLATGCSEDAAVDNSPKAAPKKQAAAEVVEVDKDALAEVLASNDLTLVDFTAVW